MNYLELFKDKKIMHVSHLDLDGISCRVVAEHLIKPIAKEYIPLNTSHGDDLNKDFNLRQASTCDYILFTDINPELDLYNKIGGEKVFIFDHHQSARDELGELDGYEFDLDKCGTKIFYCCLTEGKIKNDILDRYVNLVDVYDLWQTEHLDWSNAKNLHHAMFGYIDWKRYDFIEDTDRYDNFIHIQLKKFEKAEKFFFTQYEVKKISDAHKKEKKMYEQAMKNLELRVDGEDNPYAFTIVDSKISLTAYRLMKELDNKIKYIVIQSNFAYKREKKFNLSLRSPGEYDVRYIAEKHEGGGHKLASGIELKDEQFALDFISGKKHLI